MTNLSWDKWFHNICVEVGKKSKCLSRQIGSILVRDKSIISTGYNGPARSIPHCWERYKIDPALRYTMRERGLDPDDPKHHQKCPRQTMGFKSGEGLEWCVAGHSEENALLNAARMGIRTKGCKLYMDCGIPCKNCLIKIINCGIEEIIVTKMEFYDISAKYLLDNSNLKVRVYDHLK